MRHIEVRDLWLQKEVREGKIKVFKVPGESNPADLMTKILSIKDIKIRLEGMSMRVVRSNVEEEVSEVGWIGGMGKKMESRSSTTTRSSFRIPGWRESPSG